MTARREEDVEARFDLNAELQHAEWVRDSLGSKDMDGISAVNLNSRWLNALTEVARLSGELQEAQESESAWEWTAGELERQLNAAEGERERLREALAFYADEENHRWTLQDAASGRNSRVVDDGGHRARAALSAGAEQEKQDG